MRSIGMQRGGGSEVTVDMSGKGPKGGMLGVGVEDENQTEEEEGLRMA